MSWVTAVFGRGDAMRLPDTAVRGFASRLGLSARRQGVRVIRAAYYGMERSPLRFMLRLPAVQWLKSLVTYMPAEQVFAVLDALTAAGVRCWVAGGWGVDALLGRQTRRHYDLDLVISDANGDLERVEHVLTGAGFQVRASEFNPGLAMPLRYAWQDGYGYSVEVMPVALLEPPFSMGAAPGTAGGPPFTEGVIGGRPVPCLSAALQFTLHQGYAPRLVDEADVGALRSHVTGTEGTAAQ